MVSDRVIIEFGDRRRCFTLANLNRARRIFRDAYLPLQELSASASRLQFHLRGWSQKILSILPKISLSPANLSVLLQVFQCTLSRKVPRWHPKRNQSKTETRNYKNIRRTILPGKVGPGISSYLYPPPLMNL